MTSQSWLQREQPRGTGDLTSHMIISFLPSLFITHGQMYKVKPKQEMQVLHIFQMAGVASCLGDEKL